MKALLTLGLALVCATATAEEAAPELTSRLFYVQLEGIPSSLLWSEATTLEVGSTLFGCVVTNIENVAESDQSSEPGSEKEERLVATLVRGGQLLKLEQGDTVKFVDYYATFASTQEEAAVRSTIGDTFVVENHFFKFLSVDVTNKICTVIDMSSGETLRVGAEP